MSSAGTRIRFLPSLSHRFGGPVVRGAGQLQSELRLQVIKEGSLHATVTRAVVLRGPGDVVAMHPGAVARVEPPPGSNDFEPNYFPFVEFVDPDFPWRYSLDPDTAPERRRPWLSLLVLSGPERQRLEEEDGLQVVGPVEDGREVLRITGDLLPSLQASWALAHVHLNRHAGEPIGELLGGAPSQICSRLLCCRRLEPRTRYFAFLVPLYRAALTSSAAPTFDLAWDSPAREEIFELPIYYRWEFMTSEHGDFESLARALQASSVTGLPIGTRAVDAGRMRAPGVVGPPLFFEREGALSVPGFAETRPSYADASEPLPLTTRLAASLNASLETGAHADEEDPLVTFPVYGSHHRRVSAVTPPSGGAWAHPAPWLHELNLDFRNRVGAGLGAEVVRQNDHEYVKECWRQVGKLRKVNERLRLSEAGLRIGLTHEKKHVRPLGDDRFVLLTAPYHAHVATTARGAGKSYARAFAMSGIRRGILSQAFKRIAHRAIGIDQVRPFEPYRETCDCVCGRKPPKPVPDEKASAVLRELLGGRGFVAQQIPEKPEVIPVTPVDVGAPFRERFDLQAAMVASLEAIIRFGDGRSVPERLDPIVAGPEIEHPMYRPLSRLSLDYVLPGIEQLPSNGVTLMVENRRFIESYMAGLNHELTRELIWRRYPIYRSATVFRRFWESAARPESIPDIAPMHTWLGDLGTHRPSGGAPSLVLVIKGDLIRRYPGTIVYAVRVDRRTAGRYQYWSEAYPDAPPPMEPPTLIEPIFRAQVGTDVQFVGFPLTMRDVRGPARNGEYYFVLQENQDLPRFGLDVQTAARRRPDLSCNGATAAEDLGWADVTGVLRAGYVTEFPDELFGSAGRAATSASVAARTYQQPVRVAIHASHLLNGD
jgi:hypothetical protein